MSKTTKSARIQTIIIVNPNNSTKQAVVNIWYIGDDIVLGGIGWCEYFDYEEIQKAKEKVK